MSRNEVNGGNIRIAHIVPRMVKLKPSFVWECGSKGGLDVPLLPQVYWAVSMLNTRFPLHNSTSLLSQV